MTNDSKSRIMNLRPLFVLALCLALGIVIGRYIEYNIYYAIAAAGFLAVAICLHRKLLILLLCVAFALLGVFISSAAIDVNYEEAGSDLSVKGRIIEAPYVTDYGSTIIVLDNAKIDGKKSGGIKLYLDSSDFPELEIGDVIKTKANVEIPKGVKNPGGYNERLQLSTKGIYYKAYTDSVDVIGKKEGLFVWAGRARSYIGGVIDDIFEDDVSGVAKAMLLGEKQGLDEQVYSNFRDTGMAHVLAVSGLHAAILIGFIYYLMRLLKVGRTLRLVVSLIFIAVYACVTGLTPSIVRASIMASAVLLGTYFGRQSDSLSYLSLAMIVALLINPLDLFSTSFMLSFGAVFAIITLGWQIDYWLKRRTHERMGKLSGLVAMSIGAAAGTMPFLALKFNRISTFSVITNILIIPFASAAIVMVFISTIAGIIYSTVGGWLAYVTGFFIRLLMTVIEAAAKVPGVAVDVASPPWYIIVAVFVVLFIISKFVLIKTWLKAAISFVIVSAAVLTMLLNPTGMYLVFLDVGQADAAFIRTEQGGEYLIDGGREQSEDEIIDFTIRNGYTLEAAFVSHSDADHFSGIKALYENGLLNKVYCSYQEKEYIQSQLKDAKVVAVSAGDVVWLDDKTTATVLYPYLNTVVEKKNDASLVLLIEYKGKKILFTGDIPGSIETTLFADIGNVDIYKAAHHGSRFSSYKLPLSKLQPKYSIVSVGYNNLGHPHEYAMDNLEEYSDEVYTTVDDHAVEFLIGEYIEVRTYEDSDGKFVFVYR